MADYIEHSLLSPTATLQDLTKLYREAERFRFPVICVYPWALGAAIELRSNQNLKVCTVIGFPTGSSTSQTKLYEAQDAADRGADELDVMINLSWVKMGRSEEIYQEIGAICEETGVPVKAILETSLLTDTEKQLVAEICLDAGVAFLKTSTGWFGGATIADVKLLKQVTRGQVGIKASGGIKTIDQAEQLILAGADRLGTSQGVKILQQREDRLGQGPSDWADRDG